MARAGARESLEQPSPKPRATTSGRTPGAAKAAGKTAKKTTKAESAAPEAKSKSAAAKSAPKAKAGAKAAAPAPGKKATQAKPPKAGAAPKSADVKESKAPAAKAPAAGKAKAAATRSGKGAVADGVATDRHIGFPAKTLAKLRGLLEGERETYLRQAVDLAAEAEQLASEREPGDTQFDEESGEGDTLNVERERDLALSASARQAVEEIDRALRRMDAQTYGLCERCGKKISVARLEALPYAALCIECKSREERRR